MTLGNDPIDLVLEPPDLSFLFARSGLAVSPFPRWFKKTKQSATPTLLQFASSSILIYLLLIMPPHLHPRSRSTTGLFAGTLLASLLVVGMPHLFPCPAPRRTLADSEMTITADGQQVPRMRRRRRKEIDSESDVPRPDHPTPSGAVDEEVSTFFQMEEEAQKLAHVSRECPVPKPKGLLGELLGFRNARPSEQQQTTEPAGGDR